MTAMTLHEQLLEHTGLEGIRAPWTVQSMPVHSAETMEAHMLALELNKPSKEDYYSQHKNKKPQSQA